MRYGKQEELRIPIPTRSRWQTNQGFFDVGRFQTPLENTGENNENENHRDHGWGARLALGFEKHYKPQWIKYLTYDRSRHTTRAGHVTRTGHTIRTEHTTGTIHTTGYNRYTPESCFDYLFFFKFQYALGFEKHYNIQWITPWTFTKPCKIRYKKHVEKTPPFFGAEIEPILVVYFTRIQQS